MLGHHSEDVARMGLQEAEEIFREHVASEKHHPLTLHFFQGPLKDDIADFIAGRCTRFDRPQLLREAAACGFISCVERSIEARHALLKAKTSVMKRLTPAAFSSCTSCARAAQAVLCGCCRLASMGGSGGQG